MKFLLKLYSYHLFARVLWLRDIIFHNRAFTNVNTNFSNLLYSKYASVAGNISYKERICNLEYKIFSQNGEDGLLLYIFSQVGITNKTLIEFGIEDGRECNSANLIINYGWNGLMMDGNTRNVKKALSYYRGIQRFETNRVKIIQSFVTAENINNLIANSNIEGDIDLLSIDIDGNDYWIWNAIEIVKPRVVVMEYNASFGPDKSITVKYDPSFRRFEKHKSGWYHGASISALVKLGKTKGYTLVCADSHGCNTFFVRNDVIAGDLLEISSKEAFYPQPKRCTVVPQDRQFEFINHLEYVDI